MTGLAGTRPITFIIVPDADKARDFYTGTLGLTPVSEDDFALVYDLGGTMLRVSFVSDYRPHVHTVLGWRIDDIQATAADLAARGVKFIIYDGFGQNDLGIWTEPGGGAKVAWFNDPFGNNLSLTQAP